MNTEERIRELEAKVKELEEKNNTNTTDIIAINHTISKMLTAIENNVTLIKKLTMLTSKFTLFK